MKKVIALVLVISLALPVCVAAAAGGDVKPVDKLGRGVQNALLAIGEIPYNIVEVSKDQGAWIGSTKGLVKGLAECTVRVVVGIYEIVTFLFPSYEPIIEDPEF